MWLKKDRCFHKVLLTQCVCVCMYFCLPHTYAAPEHKHGARNRAALCRRGSHRMYAEPCLLPGLWLTNKAVVSAAPSSATRQQSSQIDTEFLRTCSRAAFPKIRSPNAPLHIVHLSAVPPEVNGDDDIIASYFIVGRPDMMQQTQVSGLGGMEMFWNCVKTVCCSSDH